MTDSTSNNSVVIARDEYVANILATGIALQVLAQKTGISLEDWTQYVSEKATEQFENLSEAQIQQIVDVYEAARKA